MFFKLTDKKIFEKLGYSLDQEGILSRFLRESEEWKSHLENTKSFIKKSYQGKSYKSIAVFGSGWLLDLPIEDLIADFEEIYLFDITHPQQITHKYRKNSHVHFIEADITGGLAKYIYTLINSKKIDQHIDMSILQEIAFTYPIQFDFVVSLNILNQLDILLIDALQSHIKLNNNDIEQFRTLVQQQHVTMLQTYNYCLISDWEQISGNIDDSTSSKKLIYIDEPKVTTKQEWLWNFD